MTMGRISPMEPHPRVFLRRCRTSWTVSLMAALGLVGLAPPALTQGRFIDDVQITRSGGVATIDIQLGCPMRYVADMPTDAGLLLEVRMAPFDDCRRIAGGGIASEMLRPPNTQLADLVEVEYESLGIGDGTMFLRFERPVSYRIMQLGNLRTLRIEVDLPDASRLTELVPDAQQPTDDRPADAGSAPAEERQSGQPAPESPDAGPPVSRLPITEAPITETPSAEQPPAETPPVELRAQTRSTAVDPSAADYMINLMSTRDPDVLDPPPQIAAADGQRLYVSRIEVDGITWHRLRLGFFRSEADAQTALAALRERYPRAWIGRAEPAEIGYAREFEFTRKSAPLPVFSADAPAEPTPLDTDAEPLPATRVAELERLGREALLDQDYAAAIEAYTKLVAAPGEHRASAREFLGLAYERRGDIVRARAEYRRYLEEFADSADVVRVRQRLAGLELRDVVPEAPLRAGETEREGPWDLNTSVAQYYRRDQNQFDPDQPEITTLSALFSDLDFYLGRAGRKVDFSTRISASYMSDLLEEDEPGARGDRHRVSYAYADVGASDGRWSTRLGRQSLHTWGVLGRFDGLHFAYDLTPRKELHVTAGYPVESTRDSVQTDRSFYGAAIEFGEIFGDWNLATYVNSQTIDGVDARNAVGTELRYFDERRSFTSTIDYDVDFEELNTLLMLGTWRFPNRLTLSMLYDDRLSPILTTRNALIGQPVSTVDELLLVWSDEEIRQIAVDRTAQSRTVTLGIATPLAERLQLNLDFTRAEISGTIESAGVAAIPELGAQNFASMSLVGTGLLKGGDVNILNFRVGESETFRTGIVTWDSRFPLGRRIRFNPRIRYAVWEGVADGRQRTTVSPMLRFLMDTRNHYRVELEVGIDRQLRTTTVDETEATGRFVNFGYRANF